MPRKETITKNYLIDNAFLLARSEGIENVTARKLAAKAGCSTQPIFRLYSNMDDLISEIYAKAVEYYANFYDNCKRVADEPFANLGYAYVRFATEEPKLFKMLFLSNNRYNFSMYEILNGSNGNVAQEMNKAKEAGVVNSGDLFTEMWRFIHGIAWMTITGDYDVNDADTIELLKNTYRSFV